MRAIVLFVLASLELAPALAEGFETGSVTFNRTIDSSPGNTAWQTVNLQATYTATPVVIAGPLTHDNDHSLSVRIRNVTTTSFEIAMTSPCDSVDADPNAAGNACPPPAPGASPPWNIETVRYLVVPAGVWQFADGTRIEAGIVNTSAVRSGIGSSNAGDSVTFQHSYTGRPVVLHSVNSTNDAAWITSSVFGPGNNVGSPPDSNSFTIALEGAEVTSTHVAEDIGWVAIEPGSGSNNGHPYTAGVSPAADTDRHDDGCFTQGGLVGFSATPDVVAGHNSINGTNGGWLRFCNAGITTGNIHVHIDEDQVNDGERTGVPEHTSWFAFEADSIGELFPAGSISPFFARETFEAYALGSVAGGNAGAFWTGAWTGVGSNVESVIDVSGNPLVYTNNGDTIDGGERAFEVSGNSNNAATRDLAKTVSDPVVYASMLIRFDGVQNNNDFFALWFENAGFGSSPNFGIKMNRGDGSGPEDFFVRTTTNSVYSTDIVNGQTYFIVARIRKNGINYDQASLWVNPSNLGNAAVPAADVQTAVSSSGLSSFNTIGFRSVNLSGTDSVTIDELRIGTSWAEVTAPNELPVQRARLQIDTLSNPVVQSETLTGFDHPPVVLATVSTDRTDTPAAARIRNVTQSSFGMTVVEPPADDGLHVPVEVDYVALGEIEAGEQKLYLLDDADGFAELRRHDTQSFQAKLLGGSGWDAMSYLARFSQAPVVLAGVQSMRNDAGNPPQDPSVPWLETAVASVTDTNYLLAMDRAETTAGAILVDETIGLAILPDGSRGAVGNGIIYEALRSSDAIAGFNNGCFTTAFSSSFSDPPVVIANRNTRDGGDGGWIRRCSISSKCGGSDRYEDQDADGERSHTTEAAAILALSNVSSGADHYAVEFPSGTTAVTCAPAIIRITAHVSGHNPVPPPALTVVTLTSVNAANLAAAGVWGNKLSGSGTWLPGGDNTASYTWPGGEASFEVELMQTSPLNININLSDTLGLSEFSTPPPIEDGDIEFRSAIFRVVDNSVSPVSITTKLSGKRSDTAGIGNQTLFLQAIRDDGNQQCVGALQNQAGTPVEMASECNNPVQCEAGSQAGVLNNGSSLVAVDANDNGTVLAFSTVNLDFDADSKAPLILEYPDAGQITLHARFDLDPPNGDYVQGASNAFVVKPAGLCVESTDPDSDCASADGSCSVFRKAGSGTVENAFNLTVRGVTWESAGETDTDFCTGTNVTTPNFELSNIVLAHDLVAPLGAGTQPGALGVTALDIVDADNGTGTVATQSISEVGVFSVTATPPAYLGESITASTSANIGRFIPDRFNVTMQNTPAFGDACTGFTYQDQPFHYNDDPSPEAPVLEITALNSNGATTVNYGGDFWKLSGGVLSRDYSDGSAPAPAADFSPTTSQSGNFTLGGETDFDGAGTFTLNAGSGGDTFMYQKAVPKDTPEEPFAADVDVVFAAGGFEDSDHGLPITGSVCYDSNDDGACEDFSYTGITGTELRWGRMVINNNQTSELLSLPVPLRTEYFSGGIFTTNVDDNCTTYQSAEASLSEVSPADNLAPGDTSVTGPVASTMVVNGVSTPGNHLTVGAPGVGKTGSLDLILDLGAGGSDQPWLQFDDANPSGRVTFGIFSGPENLIYIREPWN